MSRIYLDHAATSPLRSDVLDVMLPFLVEPTANPSSTHQLGQAAAAAVTRSRERVAVSLNALPDEVVFTSGGTESDNLAVFGTSAARASEGRHIITAATEHRAVLAPCRELEAHGFMLTVLPVDGRGRVSPSALAEALRPDTVLVSLMLGNNETGTLPSLDALNDILADHAATWHVDAVQAAGKVPIDLEAHRIDLLSLSGHKLGGPQGTGALVVRRGTPLHAMLHGGGQERERRAGTENVAGIVGFAAALEAACEAQAEEALRLAALRDRLEGCLKRMLPEVMINGDPTARLPHILNFSTPGVTSDALVTALDLAGVAVSAGAACHSGATEPSHVLRAMQVPLDRVRGSIRVSLGHDTTEADMKHACATMTETVKRLRLAGMAG